MTLKILLPTRVFLSASVSQVIAEAANGFFCLLPRHVDFAAALVPGIFIYREKEGAERYLAVDEGILVKAGPEVLVSTRNAAGGGELEQLRERVESEFKAVDEQEQAARSAARKIESHFIRRFTELQEHIR